MAGSEKIDKISDQLRARICSGELRGGDTLVEDALAKEFSLSRTPIRQVLHRLALEHLVETKTGVGTIVVPEDRTDFGRDLRAYKDLLKISTARAHEDISSSDEFELSGLSSIVARLQKSPDPAHIWEYFYRMSGLVSRQLGHDLFAETAVLLGARIFRRLIISFDGDYQRLVEVIFEEYARAKRVDTGKDLLNVRISTISIIKKSLSKMMN